MDLNSLLTYVSLICSIFELGGMTKHLMTGPTGNSELCFPSTLNVPLGKLRVSEKQNSLFPLGPVIKCLLFNSCLHLVFVQTNKEGDKDKKLCLKIVF